MRTNNKSTNNQSTKKSVKDLFKSHISNQGACDLARRTLLTRSALAMGALPLRALATGLPLSFLMSIKNNAFADIGDAKYLIMSHQQRSDPVNSNVPGTYPNDASNLDDPLTLIEHAQVAQLGDAAAGYETPVEFDLGNTRVKGAAPWSTLEADLRDRFAFWHHGTFTTAHPELPSVLASNGAIKGSAGTGTDQLDALIAQETGSQLNTLLSEPISVGGSRIRYDGREVPILKPLDIKGLFQSSINNIEQMTALRGRFVDEVYKDVKQNGSPAHKAFLERYVQSQQEASAMGDQLGQLITDIDGSDQVNQAKMAVALIQLNLTPVVSLGFEFGGDNHPDINLQNEVTETDSAMTAINTLWQQLKAANLQDRVVTASLNVFGRTLTRNTGGGRDHNGEHHCMFVFGEGIKAGVVGGLEPSYKGNGDLKDFKATSIDAATGASDSEGDIPHSESLVAVGKTLAKAVGIDETIINTRFDGGKIITGALG